MNITVVGALVTLALVIAACLLVDLLLGAWNKHHGEGNEQFEA